ncbi:MAG: hypothetical protein EON58_19300, partial [Alphaproteobacteria bacterium]
MLEPFHVQAENRLLVAGCFQAPGVYLGVDYGIPYFTVDTAGNGYPTHPASDAYLGFLKSTVAQRNGGVLLNGPFNSVNGDEQPLIRRLNPDFSVDREFTFDKEAYPPEGRAVDTLAELSDGGILVRFYTTADKTYRLRCLTPDGFYDRSFDESIGDQSVNSWGGTVSTALPLPDGKILLGGLNLVRVSRDGMRDSDFTPPPAFENIICMALQADGKILVGRDNVFGDERPHLQRLNPNGSLDTTFNVPNGAERTRIRASSIS